MVFIHFGQCCHRRITESVCSKVERNKIWKQSFISLFLLLFMYFFLIFDNNILFKYISERMLLHKLMVQQNSTESLLAMWHCNFTVRHRLCDTYLVVAHYYFFVVCGRIFWGLFFSPGIRFYTFLNWNGIKMLWLINRLEIIPL